MKRLTLFTSCVYLLFLTLGCSVLQNSTGSSSSSSSSDPTQASASVSTAYDAMSNSNYTTAYTSFAAAVSADSSNADAQFGYALLTFYNMYTNSSTLSTLSTSSLQTQAISSPLDVLSISNAQNAVSLTSLAEQAHPALMLQSISSQSLSTQSLSSLTYPQAVTIAITEILPALDTAIAALDSIVAASSDVHILIPSRVTGHHSDMEIDNTEIELLLSLLHAAAANLDVIVMYNLDPGSYEIHDYNDLETLLDDDRTEFGKLRSTAYPLAAKTHANSALSNLITGLNYFKNKPGDRSNDIIPYSDSYASNLQLVTSNAQLAYDYLNQSTPYTFTWRGQSVQIQFSKLFDPPADLGDYFPNVGHVSSYYNSYSYSYVYNGVNYYYSYVSGSYYERFTFPASYDYTANGLFPNMTKSTLQAILDQSITSTYDIQYVLE